MKPENLPQETIDEIQHRLTVIWGALLMSQSFFLLMLYFTKRELFVFDPNAPLDGGNPVLVVLLAVFALSSFFLSFLIRKRMTIQAEAEQDPALIQTALIIGCAFCESISLMGCLLAFLIGYHYFFVWFVVGIAGIILHYPRKSDLLRATFKNKLQ